MISLVASTLLEEGLQSLKISTPGMNSLVASILLEEKHL